jgi:hypothetical protein
MPALLERFTEPILARQAPVGAKDFGRLLRYCINSAALDFAPRDDAL